MSVGTEVDSLDANAGCCPRERLQRAASCRFQNDDRAAVGSEHGHQLSIRARDAEQLFRRSGSKTEATPGAQIPARSAS